MGTISKNGKLYGLMPDGSWKWFLNEKQYEDEYYDTVFELNNCFFTESPEDYAW